MQSRLPTTETEKELFGLGMDDTSTVYPQRHLYVSVVVNVEGVCNSYYKQCYDFFGTSNT